MLTRNALSEVLAVVESKDEDLLELEEKIASFESELMGMLNMQESLNASVIETSKMKRLNDMFVKRMKEEDAKHVKRIDETVVVINDGLLKLKVEVETNVELNKDIVKMKVGLT